MRNKIITLIALLGIAAGNVRADDPGSGQVHETTVTYRIKAESFQSGTKTGFLLTFVRDGEAIGTSTGSKTAVIENSMITNGFSVALDDGLTLRVSMNQGQIARDGSDEYGGVIINNSSNTTATFNILSSAYHIKHIKLTDSSGTPCTLSITRFTAQNNVCDLDVDIMPYTDGSSGFDEFLGSTQYACSLGRITVTYADAPRTYTITYHHAADGVDGVTNTYPTSYPVEINDGNRGKILILGANNTLYYSSASAVNTMRAHFEISGASAVKGYQIGFGEQGTTGIIPISAGPDGQGSIPAAARGIYTLDGLRIESLPAQKGVYIKDGKKVIINN